MKVMISQPMSDKTYEQIVSERASLVKKLQDQGFEVIDTVFENVEPDVSPIFYLGKSIELLSQADRVVFMKGWENARGCKIEYDVAKYYGKEILIL